MKIGFLFAGQGSQREGMGKDLYENYPSVKKYYDSLNLSFDIKEYSFNKDLETISDTKYTQPIMVAFQVAVKNLLMDNGIIPLYTAGLSIGEYSALATAGVLDDGKVVEIAEFRGNAMVESAKDMDSDMVAVLGLDKQVIEEVVKSIGDDENKVEIANINCPGQIVISGEKGAVSIAKEILQEKGARRLVQLNVSGPFHTSYMEKASRNLREYFENIHFGQERIPVVFNSKASEKGDDSIKELMIDQVKSQVNFWGTIEYMIAQGVDVFVEIGFNGVLKGFIKKIDKNIKVYEVNSKESLESFIQEVEGDR